MMLYNIYTWYMINTLTASSAECWRACPSSIHILLTYTVRNCRRVIAFGGGACEKWFRVV